MLLVALAMPSCAAFRRPPDPVELAGEVYPSVVLLIRELPSEKLGFGAGVIVEDGLILTNQHVVDPAERLFAMRYRGDRTSYIDEDGGLRRYVFEHEAELLEAEMVLADPLNDLALVRVEDPAGAWAPVAVRAEPAQIGEPVYAVGHPQFNPWSLTAGRVSALPHGFIQHDAPLSPGSSGGPLLDARGRLVGVNTRKLFGRAEGVGYARPIDLARILWRGAPRGFELAQDSPESAWRSFLSAYERGLPEARELVSPSSQRGLAAAILTWLAESPSPDVMQRVHDRLKPLGFDLHDVPKDDLEEVAVAWRSLRQEGAETEVREPLQIARRAELVGPMMKPPTAGQILPARSSQRVRELFEAAIAFEQAHASPSMLGPLADATGVRIREVRPDGLAAAWVLLEARTEAGGSRSATGRAVLQDGVWQCVLFMPEALAEERPKGWPVPLLTRESLAPAIARLEVSVLTTLIVVADLTADAE